MTKHEFYEKRCNLLRSELKHYEWKSLNSIWDNPTLEKNDLPDIEEKIVFVPKNQEVFIGTKLGDNDVK